MPQVKNPHFRYRIINACFTNKQKRYWTIQELIDELAEHDLIVEKRAVEKDFETMRYDERLGYLAPLAYCKKEKAFYYTDPNFSGEKVPISREELRALTFGVNIIKQFKGVQMVKEFEGAVDKIVKVMNHLNHSANGKEPVIYFEKAPYYKGIELVDRLHEAISEKQPLSIVYKKFKKGRPLKHIVHPYFLKEYKGWWYLLCFSETSRTVLTFALDRMEQVHAIKVPFVLNEWLNHDEYFQYTIGITYSKEPPDDIELLFSEQQGYYIKTQHLHHTQKIVRDNAEGLVITLKLKINYELVQLLLSYGADVKVIKPLRLRNKFKELLERGWKLYEEPVQMESPLP